MRIRIETTIEDVLIFQRFELRNSPVWTRLYIASAFGVCFGIAAFLMFEPDAKWEKWLFAIVLTMVGVAYYLPAEHILIWIMEHRIRKSMTGAAGRLMVGWHELELLDGCLLAKSELMECKIDMRAIERIVGDGDRMFVCVASGQTFIIPLNLYPERQYHEFVAELRDTWVNGFAGPPIVVRAERLPGVDERIEELR